LFIVGEKCLLNSFSFPEALAIKLIGTNLETNLLES
jgi:hypothetical protein